MRRPISTLSIALSSSLLYLLTVTWHAYTCGPSEDYEKYRISYVDPDLLSDTVYRSYYRMFLQQHQEARWDNSEERDAWYSPDKRGGNLDLWSDYFDGTVPARSISDVVYHLDIAATQRAIALYDKGELADVDRVITPATDEWSQPDTLDVGSFYREVARRKDRAVLAYLLYAKKAADHAWQIDPNGWGDRKEKDIRPMTRLISEGVEALEATASPDLRRRYGFQLVRLARYSGNYDEAADYFRNYVESDPRRDALYFMALAHHAGARRLDGDLDASNELFARIFDSTEERRAESLRDIKISTPGSWERLYARASNDRERVSHLLVRGMKSRSLTFDYLEEIYAIDPRTPKLPFALMRELHRVESFLYDDRVTRDLAVQKKGTITTYNYSSDGVDSAQTNVLPNGNPVRDRHLGKGSSWDSLFFYTPDPEHHYDRDRRRLDGGGGGLHGRDRGHDGGNLALFAFVLAGQHDDLVAFAEFSSHDYSTSGASEMIFMKFLARSSRTTGPKIRVPTGSLLLFRMTAALRSKRIAVPSSRRTSLAVRTTTALRTSPFFTRPRGMASLTETTMMSPTDAYLRLEPPRTLMH